MGYPIKVHYGTEEHNIDVTPIVFNKLKDKDIITIPQKEKARQKIFGDPDPGVIKKIFVDMDGKTTSYSNLGKVVISLSKKTITAWSNEKERIFMEGEAKLRKIHASLHIKRKHIIWEYPEQVLVALFLQGNEKVLEIGGNIGRVSLVIGHILKQHGNGKNHVVMECGLDIIPKLEHYKKINHMKFHIESSALSLVPLYQRDWTVSPTFEPSDPDVSKVKGGRNLTNPF